MLWVQASTVLCWGRARDFNEDTGNDWLTFNLQTTERPKLKFCIEIRFTRAEYLESIPQQMGSGISKCHSLQRVHLEHIQSDATCTIALVWDMSSQGSK